MTLNIDITPREEAWLAAKSAEQGLPAAEIVKQLIDAQVPDRMGELEPSSGLDAKTLAAIAMLDAWIEEGKNASLEEVRLADLEVEELMRNLKANREFSG